VANQLGREAVKMVVNFDGGNILEIVSGGWLFFKNESGMQFTEWDNLTLSQREKLGQLSEFLQDFTKGGLETVKPKT
jgi:hypothetical protein